MTFFLLFKSQWGWPGPLGPPGHTPERVRSWSICALHPVPPNKYEKLHNLDFIFITFSKLINREKITGHSRVILTIFDSNHVIPYGMFNGNCVHLCKFK